MNKGFSLNLGDFTVQWEGLIIVEKNPDNSVSISGKTGKSCQECNYLTRYKPENHAC